MTDEELKAQLARPYGHREWSELFKILRNNAVGLAAQQVVQEIEWRVGAQLRSALHPVTGRAVAVTAEPLTYAWRLQHTEAGDDAMMGARWAEAQAHYLAANIRAQRPNYRGSADVLIDMDGP